jgi:gas vesicle protein
MTQAETEHPRGGGLTLFLVFVGGALVGGTAALLLAPRTGPELRRRLAGVAEGTKEIAGRVPGAIRQASSAARASFTSALKESGGKDGAASDRRHS